MEIPARAKVGTLASQLQSKARKAADPGLEGAATSPSDTGNPVCALFRDGEHQIIDASASILCGRLWVDVCAPWPLSLQLQSPQELRSATPGLHFESGLSASLVAMASWCPTAGAIRFSGSGCFRQWLKAWNQATLESVPLYN